MVPVLGVDPGLSGGLVWTDGFTAQFHVMPVIGPTKAREIFFKGVQGLLTLVPPDTHVFLERAIPMAMGSKHAFNYGRGFATLEIAIKLSGLPVTYIEPSKWTKVMHAGIDSRLKAKEKSLIAVGRAGGAFEALTMVKNKPHLGLVDALLIAMYGRRVLSGA